MTLSLRYISKWDRAEKEDRDERRNQMPLDLIEAEQYKAPRDRRRIKTRGLEYLEIPSLVILFRSFFLSLYFKRGLRFLPVYLFLLFFPLFFPLPQYFFLPLCIFSFPLCFFPLLCISFFPSVFLSFTLNFFLPLCIS